LVSADSKGIKVLGLEQIANADSKGDRMARAAARCGPVRSEAKTHDP
jgi:hypothetical protein